MADKQKPWDRGIIGYTRDFFGRIIGRPPRNERLGDMGTGSPAVERQVRQMSSDARETVEDMLPGASAGTMSGSDAGEMEELQEREVGGMSRGRGRGKSGGFDRAEAEAELEASDIEDDAEDRHGKRHGPPPHARGRALGHQKQKRK